MIANSLGTPPEVVCLTVTHLPRTQDQCQTLERLVRQDRRFQKVFTENRSRYRTRYCERVHFSNGDSTYTPRVGTCFQIQLNSTHAKSLEKLRSCLETAEPADSGPAFEEY